jgi:hypothetical protein
MVKVHSLKEIDLKMGRNKDDVKSITIRDDLVVEIKSLSLTEKVSIVEDIIQTCAFDETPYVNPIKIKVYGALRVLEESTNINIVNDTIEDIYEMYDILESAKIIDKVLPHTDYYNILNWSIECIEHLNNYQNSIVGIVEQLKNNFNSEDISNVLSTVQSELEKNPKLVDLLNIYNSEAISEENNESK